MKPDIDELLSIARQVSLGIVPSFQYGDWSSVGAFDHLIKHLKGAEAYHFLAELCDRFPTERQHDNDLSGYIHLLTLLARQTNTTEMPPGMTQLLADCPDKTEDLRAWYRVT